MVRALGPGSVSSFLKVILDVFYYLLWVVGAAFALLILFLLLISFDPRMLAALYDHVSVFGQPPGLAAVAQAILVELYLLGLMIIVQRLRRVFATMTAGDPFHPDNVRRLRVIALVLALLEIDRYIAHAFDRFVLGEHLRQGESVNLTAWFAVLVIVVLAEVFREGARLRHDAELTI